MDGEGDGGDFCGGGSGGEGRGLLGGVVLCGDIGDADRLSGACDFFGGCDGNGENIPSYVPNGFTGSPTGWGDCIPSVRLGDRPRGGQKVLGPSSGRSGDISCCDVPTSGGVTKVVDIMVKFLVVRPRKSPIVELASTSSSSVPVPLLLD